VPAHGTVARRVETLRESPIFSSRGGGYSDEQIGCLTTSSRPDAHIETSPRQLLAIASPLIDTAPPLTIRALAFDYLTMSPLPFFPIERLDYER